jgi:hypothetical protein
MSKSKTKNYGARRDWYEDESEEYDYKDQKQRRKEKRMKNLIRSKNIDRLLEMEDEEH